MTSQRKTTGKFGRRRPPPTGLGAVRPPDHEVDGPRHGQSRSRTRRDSYAPDGGAKADIVRLPRWASSGHRRPSTQKKMRVCCCRDTRRYHKSVLKLVEQQDETFAQEISAIGGGRCRAADRLTGRRGGNPSRRHQLSPIASEQGSHRTYNSESSMQKRLLYVASVAHLLFLSQFGDACAAGAYDGEWNGSATVTTGRCKPAIVADRKSVV